MADGPALNGYWLPDLPGLDLEVHERPLGHGHVPLRLPMLTPRALRQILVALKANRAKFLARRPVLEIVAAVDAAARRLTGRGGALYDELVAVLPQLTGYSSRMIEVGLERMGAGWRAEALRGTLEGEFGTVDVLDDFQPREPRGFQRAFGAPLTTHIFSGNIPGVSVTSLIRALCVKSAAFGKTAAGEPYFAVCFARALAAEDPELASCLAVTYWPGGSKDLEAVAFSEAGVVIAYGADETVSGIACRVPPSVRFVGYPNRVGAALVSRSSLNRADVPALARSAALDVVTFDQQGCVSPHTIYVETGGEVEPLDFARALGVALEKLAVEIPRGAMAPGESALIHQLRVQAEMRGATVLTSESGTEWTVILEDRVKFEPSPLNRVIQVQPVGDLSEAVTVLERIGRHLQTVAIAAVADEVTALAARLGAIGATRLVAVGEAAWPAPHWHHDGRFQFLDLVHFVDLDTD